MVYLVNILNPDTPSGGNIFNLEFVSKLQSCGVDVAYKYGMPMALLLKDIPSRATVIVDSVCLNEVTFDWDILHGYNCFVLLHMAPTESNMLSVNERERLSIIEAYIFSSFPVLALGYASINFLEKKYNIKVKSFIIPSFRTVGVEKSNYNSTPIMFISVGTVCRDKGTNLLIESLSMLENKNWTCNIYGAINNQFFYNECMQLVNEVGLNRQIHFKGVVSQKELQYQYCLSDLLIHTSLHENSSIAVKDAVLIGLPFVITPTGDFEMYQKMDVGQVAENFELNSILKALNAAVDQYPELVYKSKIARQVFNTEIKQVSFEETIKFLVC